MRTIALGRIFNNNHANNVNNNAVKAPKVKANRLPLQNRKFSEDWGRRRRGGPFFDDFFDEQLSGAFQDAIKSFQTSFNAPRQRGDHQNNERPERANEAKDLREAKEATPSLKSLFTSGWSNFSLKEKDDSFEFSANIETFDPKDIKIEVKDNYLHVSGKSKEEKNFNEEGGFKRSQK